jgi:catechol 2,3-dioxygenase-like lactoylglutathione lyase family enzyme
MLDSSMAVPTIAVSDLGRARKFYEETLGLKFMDETPGGIRFQAGKGTWLFVYPSQFAGTNQATCMSFEVDDLAATVKDLRDRGVTFEEYDFPGLKTVDGIADMGEEKGAWFKDLDGNILALGSRTS